MNLTKYDGKCIRLTDKYGETFEGICSYNSIDYTYHEYGVEEESIQIICFLFYKSQIKEIKSLENHKGPYGRFSKPYGLLEELTVEDGVDLIDEIMSSEEEEHINRLLDYMYDNIEKIKGKEQTTKLLREYAKHSKNNIITEKVQNIIKKISEQIK